MTRKMFTNLPVKDLQQSVAFFTKLGFTFNPQFTDENATCMIVGEDAYIMLLTEEFFQRFTKKALVDATTQTEAIISVTAESKEDVDEMIATALSAGGKTSNDASDQGFMYTWSFQDLDGHLWEVFYMDPAAIQDQS